jgi:hypothetical protein
MVWAVNIALTISSCGTAMAFAGDPGQFMGYYAYPQPILHGAVGVQHGAGHGHPVPAPPPRYPQLDAALYPAPQPGIPTYTGGTIITNPALAPHEMLYPHAYRALYPPYYYKVRMDGFSLPLIGGKTCHRVELQWTEVKVKYKSQISPFTLFFPPK